jgi:hypothetical protein
MCDLIGMVQEFITGRAMHINDVSVMDGNSDTISLASDVLVSNPSSHDLPVYSLSYRIMSGGRYIHTPIHTFIHPSVHALTQI